MQCINNGQITTNISHKYYVSHNREQSSHELLKNASVVQSDYAWVRAVVAIWDKILNMRIGNFHPLLSAFCLCSRSHCDYKNEIDSIARFSSDQKEKIRSNTVVYGGETEEAYASFVQRYDRWKALRPDASISPTKIFWYDQSDALGAARAFREKNSNAKIAITNFANAVRVGGADSTGGKGSQEEYIMRKTYLRVSLEKAAQEADQQVRSQTGRYLQYYSAIVSKEVPTIDDAKETFGYISAAAPDLRTGLRSEGNYLRRQTNPTLLKEVLYRKLSAVMMAAAIQNFNVLEIGPFGCGAFGNNPETVAAVLKDLLVEDRFQGMFTHIILPIGAHDSNRAAFERVFPAVT